MEKKNSFYREATNMLTAGHTEKSSSSSCLCFNPTDGMFHKSVGLFSHIHLGKRRLKYLKGEGAF